MILGVVFGLLIHTSQPQNQIFYFEPFAVRTSGPIQCGSIPQNYSVWLGINVVGNRTGMSFSLISIYATGLNIRVDVPLNRTAFVEYKVINSTLETIITPLPNYFDPGTVLTLALTYSITNYAPNTVTLAETPITGGIMSC
jgi:hypothetical protein